MGRRSVLAGALARQDALEERWQVLALALARGPGLRIRSTQAEWSCCANPTAPRLRRPPSFPRSRLPSNVRLREPIRQTRAVTYDTLLS